MRIFLFVVRSLTCASVRVSMCALLSILSITSDTDLYTCREHSRAAEYILLRGPVGSLPGTPSLYLLVNYPISIHKMKDDTTGQA